MNKYDKINSFVVPALAILVGLWTVLMLLFKVAYVDLEGIQTVGSLLGTDLSPATGFSLFSLRNDMLDWEAIVFGIISMFSLCFGLAGIVFGVLGFAKLNKRVLDIFVIIQGCFMFLFFACGIVALSTGEAVIEISGAKVKFDVSTQTYIAFIISCILVSCYVAVPTIINSFLGKTSPNSTPKKHSLTDDTATIQSLKGYKQLLDDQILTEEEFKAKKSQLLNL